MQPGQMIVHIPVKSQNDEQMHGNYSKVGYKKEIPRLRSRLFVCNHITSNRKE